MRIKGNVLKKIVSVLSSTLLLINSFTPYFLVAPSFINQVKADDEQTITQTQEEPTPTDIVAPTETIEPTATPTVDVTPTPTVEVTPTVIVTPVDTITPTEIPTLEPTEKPSVTSPPQDTTVTPGMSEQPASTVTPTPTESPTLQSKVGTVETNVVESFICRADSLNGCNITTDKADYPPNSVAIISAYGFLANSDYSLSISTDGLNKTFDIKTDDQGAFTYSYNLYEEYHALYQVDLKDSSTQTVASITFTDSNSVTICHSTSSNTNPYNKETPNVQNDGSLVGGHLDHTGSVYPTTGWGDIIPSYNYTCQVTDQAAHYDFANKVYSCENSWTLHDTNKCEKNNKDDVSATYSCPSGYLDFGNPTQCQILVEITYKDGICTYPGMNLTAEGQVILNNGCAIPTATPIPPTSTPIPTSTPTSTPEEKKENICHNTSSGTNPWVAQQINANELQSHLDNGDKLYEGLIDDKGRPTKDGDQWCNDKYTPPSICGNDQVETGETCDGNSKSCTTDIGYSGTQSCNTGCDGWNSCETSQYCGDGFKNGNEECDGADGVTDSDYVCNSSCELVLQDNGKVDICHATSSDSNPYNSISPNIKNDGSLTGGHLNHTGPVYPGTGWGDIIPAYTSGSFNYPGMNWTTEGQAILRNGCKIPEEGAITAHKFSDLDQSGIQNKTELGIQDWKMTLYGSSDCTGDSLNQDKTDASGDVTFYSITPNTAYSILEESQTGWTNTTPTCQSVTVNPGQTKTVNFGNIKYGKVNVLKYEEVNGDGDNEGDKVLGGWTMNLTGQVSQTTGEDGKVTFANLLPGTYALSEDFTGKEGWTQTNISCKKESGDETSDESITVEAGDVWNCYVGNQYVTPTMRISKSNNGADNTRGGSVTYKIILKVLENRIFNVLLKDLLPKGFTFDHLVSTTINGVPFTPGFTGYHSPATYDIGDLKMGDEVVIEYEANIDGSQPLGVYKDLAWASGNKISDDSTSIIYADSPVGDEGHLENINNFVGTAVGVNGTLTEEGNTTITEEGQVLGASTSLPATGANPMWLMIALLLSVFGAISIVFGLMFKKAKSFLVIMLLVVGFLFTGSNAYAASNVTIRLSEPKTPTKLNNFTIDFVTLDLSGSSLDLTVKCFYKRNLGDGWTQYGPIKDITTLGGNSDSCQEVSSIVNESQKTYYFKATANGIDSDSIVAVGYDDRDPSTPTSFHKEKNGCEYKVFFKTADDGQTTRVEIYRSDLTTMALNGTTKVSDINIGPNTEGSYTQTVSDCNKTYYYIVRAFNSAGNASGPIGDSVTISSTSTTTTSTTEGAIPVANVTLAGGGTTGGEAGSVLGEETKEGTKSAEEVVNVKNTPTVTGSVKGAFDYVKTHKKISLGVILGLGIIGYVIYKIKIQNSKFKSEIQK